MKERFITGAIFTVILIAVLSIGTPFIQIVVTVLALMAIHELFSAVKIHNIAPLTIPAYIGTLCFMIAQMIDKSLFMPVLYVYIAVIFIMYMSNRKAVNLSHAAISLMLTVYAAFMFGHIMYIRVMDNGYLLIWTVFITAFFTDTCAMFGGKFFGRHKLCPVLSPKKTIEGSVCGIIGSVVGMVAFCAVCEGFFKLDANYINAIIIGLFASAVSQLGDLSASCIKREFGIKDYGKLMPGHGGVMDRFDSVLFAAPFVYYMFLILPVI